MPFVPFWPVFQKVCLAKLLMGKKQSLELDLPNDNGVFECWVSLPCLVGIPWRTHTHTPFCSILHPPFGRWMWTFSHWPLPSPRISPCCRFRRRTAAPSCKTPAGNILSLSSLQGTFEKNFFHLCFFWQGSGVGFDEKRNQGELCDIHIYIYIYICKHRNRWYFLDLEPWTACFTLSSFPHFLRWIWTKSARWSFTRNAPWRRRPRASVCHLHVAVVFGSPSTGHVWHGDAPCVRWRMRRHRNPVPWSMGGVRIPDLTFTCWPLWICL